ncbi:MAG: DUF4168 domain-containing protein [Cytophagaceae bacterium]|nr:DUF4168 domain-containing protein [Gemmatimonadaceae bacterium]
MRRTVHVGLLVLGLGLGVLGTPAPVASQAAASAAGIPTDKLEAFARAHIAIDQVRERANAEFADPRNKKADVQEKLRDKLRDDVRKVLKEQNLTEAEYDRFTMAVSADTAQRRAFDALVAQLTAKKASP